MTFAIIAPLILFLIPFFPRKQNPEFYHQYILGEFGAVEILTAIISILAFLAGVMVLLNHKKVKVPLFLPWFALFTLACFYFAGEESSWGQHIFKWATPENWEGINYHAETNLHNMKNSTLKYIFYMLPFHALTLIAVFGGVFAPLIMKLKNIEFDPKNIFYWIIPTWEALPVGIFVTFVVFMKDFVRAFHLRSTVFFESYLFDTHIMNEHRESLLAFFLFIYAFSVYKKLSRSD